MDKRAHISAPLRILVGRRIGDNVFNSKLRANAIRSYVNSKLALLLLVFTLAACGDSNNSSTPSPTATAGASSGGIIVTPSAAACYLAANSLATVKSFHFVYTETQTISTSGFGASTPGTSSGSGSFSAEGDADFTHHNWHYLASDSRAERSDITGEWIHTGSKAYHKGGGGWTIAATADALPFTLNSKLGEISGNLPPANQVKFLGVESVGGEASGHCQFASDAQGLGGAATYDVWASNRSGALTRIVASRKADSFSLTLSQLDQPVTIAPPQ